ncbi:hypothetical protein HORIV_29560 [Vreelandella olivaria]|uniref:ABC transporter domain-containing protein n=1 Tax=Vreelandella olivaria TaxID=390919 RepID=A0ABN5WVX8_9GAMM|nr:hypothetical protein HORIV_29560 [Halomonas olivaria]
MDGKDVTNVSVRKRNVSMVYQQFINYPSLTVYDNIASPLKLAKQPKSEIDKRVGEIAEMLHIEQLLNRYPQELSGGQQQRTAMGRALVKDADLILFDEPLVNLDYKLREELRDELRELFKARNCIAVYATTEPNEALALGAIRRYFMKENCFNTALPSRFIASPMAALAQKCSLNHRSILFPAN